MPTVPTPIMRPVGVAMPTTESTTNHSRSQSFPDVPGTGHVGGPSTFSPVKLSFLARPGAAGARLRSRRRGSAVLGSDALIDGRPLAGCRTRLERQQG